MGKSDSSEFNAFWLELSKYIEEVGLAVQGETSWRNNVYASCYFRESFESYFIPTSGEIHPSIHSKWQNESGYNFGHATHIQAMLSIILANLMLFSVVSYDENTKTQSMWQ